MAKMIDPHLWNAAVLLSDPKDVDMDAMLTYQMNYDRLMAPTREAAQRTTLRTIAKVFVTAFEEVEEHNGRLALMDIDARSIDPADQIFAHMNGLLWRGENVFPSLTFEDVRKWTQNWARYRNVYETMTDLMRQQQEMVNDLEDQVERLKGYNERLRTALIASEMPTEDLAKLDELDEPTVRICTGDLPKVVETT